MVEGVVTRVADFGVFVQIEGLVEGLMHVSETPIPRGAKLADHYHEGDTVRARILRIEDAEMKVGLSGVSVDEPAAPPAPAAPEAVPAQPVAERGAERRGASREEETDPEEGRRLDGSVRGVSRRFAAGRGFERGRI